MRTYYTQIDAASDFQLHSLKTDFLQSLPVRIEYLLQSWNLEKSSSDHIHATYEQARSLAGSAAIFGYHKISVIAREIKNYCIQINNREISMDAAREAIQRLLKELQTNSAHHVTQVLKSSGPSDKISDSRMPLVYFIHQDLTAAGELIYFISSTGYEVETFERFELLDTAVQQREPDVIIVSLMEGHQRDEIQKRLSSYSKKLNIPLIIMGTQDNLEMRLYAIRTGACHYVIAPPDPRMLIHTLDRLTSMLVVNSCRAFLIDNRTELSQAYRHELEQLGVNVKCQELPELAITEYRDFRPDVIVIDIQNTAINNAELACLIRQDEDFKLVPIVFLGNIDTDHNRLESIYPGVNTLLNRSDSGRIVARAIKAQAEHARSQQNTRAGLRITLNQLEYLQNVIDEHAIISMTDKTGNISYVNHKLTEISGYQAHELLGQNHRILKSELHDEVFYKEMWATISSGGTWHGTLTNRAKNGRLYDVDTTIVPKLNDAGIPEAYVAIRTDITEIKALQRRVSDEAERLSLALEATHSGMWEWNVKTNQVIYGPLWIKLMGYDTGEQLSWPMLIHAEDLQGVIAKLMQHIDGQSPLYESEHRQRFADGNWHWVRETGKIIEYDTDQAPARLVGTTQLIDDRIAMEQQQHAMQEKLLHAAKMESIGQLTAGIAHDFNNLLGAILGFTELSMEVLDVPEQAGNIKNYLGQVLSAGTRAKELISQMLLFSRISPDTGIKDAPICLLRPAIAEVTHLAQSSIPSGININFLVENDNIQARIQPVHLHQVLLNLILNARDALGEFGNITIILSRKSIDGNCHSCHNSFSGDFVEISVHDDGKGIEPDQYSRLFEPFYSTKDVGKGTGMGLSVTHGIVHALHGHLSVASSAENGTTFKVYLPASAEAKHGHSEPAQAQDNANGKIVRLDDLRIMVVDDEITITNMISDFIELHGGKVTVHNKPDKALSDFIRRPDDFDLIITDATMPGLSGLELAQSVLKFKPKLPVLMCTGYSSFISEDIALRNGIAGFMQKPVELSTLMEWIQQNFPARLRRAEGV